MASVKEVETVFGPRPKAISEAIAELASDYQRKAAVVERLLSQYESHKNNVVQTEQSILVQEKAQAILLKLEEVWRKDFEKGIEQVVTEGVELVFGKGSAFHIDTQQRAGASAITFEIETPQALTEIHEAEGGSLVQVVSFLLRLILVKASVPPLRQVIILDEPFEGVHAENVPLVALLVRKMVDESQIQVIMVTQNEKYMEYADKVYDVTKTKGVASVRELEAG